MSSKSATRAKMSDLAEIQADLKKRFGRDVLFRASDPKFQIRRISTGILTLDFLLGGGVARGRITEFYGGYSAMKSQALYRLMAAAQREGLLCGLVDAEHSFDPKHAAKLGVDLDKLVMLGSDLEQGEELIDYAEVIIRSGKFDVVGIDSIAALVPKDELEASAESPQMGKMGKMTSKLARKLNAINNGKTALILINQVREAIGVHFGNPEKPVGGRAIGFFASQRVEFRKGAAIKGKIRKSENGKLVEKDGTVGRTVQLRVEKDKTGGNAERDGSFDYYIRGRRVDRPLELISLGLQTGIVEQDGLRYSCKWFPKPMMKKDVLPFLAKDTKTALRLEMAIRHAGKEDDSE